MHTTQHFIITNPQAFKEKLLAWAAQFNTVVFLDSNQYPNDRYAAYECLLAVANNPQRIITATNNLQKNSFEQLQQFHEKNTGWIFGFLGYDLKNETENLQSANFDGILLPDMFFFVPDIVVHLPKNSFTVTIVLPDETAAAKGYQIFDEIKNHQPLALVADLPIAPFTLQPRMSRLEYLHCVQQLQQHIAGGDVYEVNLCREWYAPDAQIDPTATFARLNALAEAPFSAFVRCNNRYLLCASPERFLKKQSDVLISQPIKGTMRRNLLNPHLDRQLKEALYNNPKERAENVMIVDLVRNDLTRSAQLGTIQVPEIFGVYSFKTVHHLISTITAKIRPDVHWTQAIKNAFPMGSMTGAPKIMAMQLIEQYENTRRGLFSGSVGYITPQGDFDFNVVIRSLLYHAGNRYLSLQVGGAITYSSIPEQEYEECLLKAQTAMRALGITDLQ